MNKKYQFTSEVNPKVSTLRCIIIKMLRTKDKQRTRKAMRGTGHQRVRSAAHCLPELPAPRERCATQRAQQPQVYQDLCIWQTIHQKKKKKDEDEIRKFPDQSK